MCVTNTLLSRKPVSLARTFKNEGLCSSAAHGCANSFPQTLSCGSNGLPNRPKRRLRKPQKPGKTAKNQERQFVVHDYHDRSTEPCSLSEDEDMVVGHGHHNNRIHFPLKLHTVLDEVAVEGLSHIVSWMPHGRCFVIHKPKEFTEIIMSKYFRQSKLTSFQRQLNLYGFQRISRGKDSGGYYNEYFLRGRPALSKRMTRVKVKGTRYKAASNPNQEPDFYAMPFVSPDYIPGCLGSSRSSSESQGVLLPQHSANADILEPLPVESLPAIGHHDIVSLLQPSMVESLTSHGKREGSSVLPSLEEVSVGDLSSDDVADFCADWIATEDGGDDETDLLEEQLMNDGKLASMIEMLLAD